MAHAFQSESDPRCTSRLQGIQHNDWIHEDKEDKTIEPPLR